MLSLDPKLASKIGNYFPIAIDSQLSHVYAITSNFLKCRPCIIPSRPDKLLRREDWLKFMKKYRLSNSDVRKLKSTWSLGEPSFQSKNPRALMAFSEIESLLLRRMRGNYNPSRGDLFPWMAMTDNNHSPDNMLLVGNTGSGKSTFLNKLLTTVNKDGTNYAFSRPIVCFSLHQKDPSLAPSRKLHKKRWLDIDAEKITGSIDLSMLEPGSLVIFDDILELTDHRKTVLLDLLHAIATRGRHLKGKSGNSRRGCEYVVISHQGSSRQLMTVRNSSKAWVLFVSASRNQAVHMLRARLHKTKKEVEQLLERCGDSRFAYIRHHHPACVISSNHIELL